MEMNEVLGKEFGVNAAYAHGFCFGYFSKCRATNAASR